MTESRSDVMSCRRPAEFRETPGSSPKSLDDLTFAKLVMFGTIPSDYPRPADGPRLGWPARIIDFALSAVLIALIYRVLIQIF